MFELNLVISYIFFVILFSTLFDYALTSYSDEIYRISINYYYTYYNWFENGKCEMNAESESASLQQIIKEINMAAKVKKDTLWSEEKTETKYIGCKWHYQVRNTT